MANRRQRVWPLIVFWAAILCAAPGLASAGGVVDVINAVDCPTFVPIALVFHDPGMPDGEWEVAKTIRLPCGGASASMQADDQGKQRVWRLFVVGLGTKPGDKLHCKTCKWYPVVTPPCRKTARYDKEKNIIYFE